MNLWPAFERVWAPEEVYFPTALSLCGHMDEVSTSRALTHSQWDERAANHKDRAHPIEYDGCFDETLVGRVRGDGCLFMRKMKRELDVSVWEQVVVRRKRGGQDDKGTVANKSEQETVGRGGRDWEMERGGRQRERDGHGHHHHQHDHGERNNNRSHHSSSTGYDSRRGHTYDARRRNEGDGHQRQKRGRGDDSHYDGSWSRQRRRR
mmetsp:Transcript_36727/g.59967  ORF Transcript_36727/g.59967 Transcript_36727/m.59967 type:complete len:207 (+) Transcript_36727:357-977(+)